jgi:hypothetical protein
MWGLSCTLCNTHVFILVPLTYQEGGRGVGGWLQSGQHTLMPYRVAWIHGDVTFQGSQLDCTWPEYRGWSLLGVLIRGRSLQKVHSCLRERLENWGGHTSGVLIRGSSLQKAYIVHWRMAWILRWSITFQGPDSSPKPEVSWYISGVLNSLHHAQKLRLVKCLLLHDAHAHHDIRIGCFCVF